MKEILRFDATVNKHTRSKRKKYSISKESYKLTNQLNHTPKEIDIKDKAIETAKINK